MPGHKITFSATFTDQEVLDFATGNGWVAEINESPNPETDIQFCTRISRENFVTFLSIPQINNINVEKELERVTALDALKTSVDAGITDVVEVV